MKFVILGLRSLRARRVFYDLDNPVTLLRHE